MIIVKIFTEHKRKKIKELNTVERDFFKTYVNWNWSAKHDLKFLHFFLMEELAVKTEQLHYLSVVQSRDSRALHAPQCLF